MNIEPYKKFLETIADDAKEYCSITENNKLVSLSLYFWSFEEIIKSLKLRADWEVGENLIPFYGDWHDLYCIDATTSKIIYINDKREIICEWQDKNYFKNSLSKEEVPSKGTDSIVSAKLDF